MKICILTSCILPNTDVAVSALTPERRLSDLLLNVGFLHSLGLFDLLLIADPSMSNHSGAAADLRNTLHDSLTCLESREPSTELRVIFPRFSEHENDTIKLRGKGYSELLILQAAIKCLEESLDPADIIFKLSGRYRIQNMNKLVRQMLRGHLGGAAFCCEVNRISARLNTVFYSFIPSLTEKICGLRDLVDDSRGVYVESIFYREIYLRSCILSSRVGPLLYSYELSSGSKALTYRLRAQFLRMIASFV